MLVAAVLVVFLLGAAQASAATRYAAPGGNEIPGSECLQSNPCSLFNAASRFAAASKLEEGDDVIVEPGTYSTAARELGSEGSISPEAHVSIHGMAGQPRPVIVATGGNGGSAFFLGLPGQTLSRVEILASEGTGPWDIRSPSSVIDGVVAVSSGGVPCFATSGLVRDSVLLFTAPSISALNVVSFRPQETFELRNVTAIATGADSKGLRAVAETAGDDLTVHAIGLLVRGKRADVSGHTTNSTHVTVTLSRSDFATAEEEVGPGGGTVTITHPGEGDANIKAEPLLAADGYHQLPGSPTIDAGALDPTDPSLSGATDVDGNARSIGAAPDIGADELQLASTTSLACAPSAAVGDKIPCTVTVSAAGGSPTGTVRFSSDGPGSFTGGGSCNLAPAGKAGAGMPACDLVYTPSAVGGGRHAITASFPGDASHLASQGSATIRVLTKSQATPNTKLKKKPPRKSASRKATFTFASDTPGSLFECKLDRKRFKPCRSPLRLKHLKRGRHTLSVRAVGPTGIADPSPASFRWTVS